VVLGDLIPSKNLSGEAGTPHGDGNPFSSSVKEPNRQTYPQLDSKISVALISPSLIFQFGGSRDAHG
jgi:hypothetical protein